MQKIYVTKTFLPDIDVYKLYIHKIWQSNQLTNQGSLVKELENKLSKYLDVEHFHYVSNGTIALQLALNALDIKEGEIITTPFTYVATMSSILWERCTPVFVDIKPDNFTINADKIEEKITPETKAIMAVHIFGYACDVEKIDLLAKKHDLKVIYDGAQAFGSKYKNKSLLSYGDISTCSFHATKLFHTVEGGACIVKDEKISDKLELAKRFGHNGDEHIQLGINCKNSEIHAAMGLANFPHIEKNIDERKRLSNLYTELLEENVEHPKEQINLEYNYSYYPVVFKSEEHLLKVFDNLNNENIFPRRYFYPSLNTLPYIENKHHCPVSEDISKRIACLPLYVGMDEKIIEKIAKIINRTTIQ